ncbi:hypothetical protein ALQ29_01573 [Pseudomonas marginalis pv. marginalis]|uniref:Uncharacterized protein n=1 Tax=Pseudomonas marginalis pv. marginalis TaxID=97473 RepID=A0A3M4AND2_PSEMA|nr:hypothetical protein ALQ38_03520 [Pseudomonas marginalis pv. marginalis]RMP08428.1 hypothetical protein ALQ29_01573 [Pseudomonas marginalis pv. marginalis]
MKREHVRARQAEGQISATHIIQNPADLGEWIVFFKKSAWWTIRMKSSLSRVWMSWWRLSVAWESSLPIFSCRRNAYLQTTTTLRLLKLPTSWPRVFSLSLSEGVPSVPTIR